MAATNNIQASDERYCIRQKQHTAEDLMSSVAPVDTIDQVKSNMIHGTHKNWVL